MVDDLLIILFQREGTMLSENFSELSNKKIVVVIFFGVFIDRKRLKSQQYPLKMENDRQQWKCIKCGEEDRE